MDVMSKESNILLNFFQVAKFLIMFTFVAFSGDFCSLGLSDWGIGSLHNKVTPTSLCLKEKNFQFLMSSIFVSSNRDVRLC